MHELVLGIAIGAEDAQGVLGALWKEGVSPTIRGIPDFVKHHLVEDLLTAAMAMRVFGRDALAVLRRLAAASVLMGMSELRGRRDAGGGEQ
ncbi:hypothetical protein [Streptomyces gilvosporeus]|uniref:Uncharacterized protein n=1 Tax=Streptomyces gilvosporeus TaxID=553510 RepID=A0A1V0TYQ2_9ACTN|nr:hypothetical protein [Streptomyces gilvosporeus]ARF58076.1 hypothetical protein B1H19_31335 [Streptomyces gilvosporeus]